MAAELNVSSNNYNKYERGLFALINSLVTFVTSDEKCRGELEFKFKPGFNFRDYIVNLINRLLAAGGKRSTPSIEICRHCHNRMDR